MAMFRRLLIFFVIALSLIPLGGSPADVDGV